MDTVNLLSNFFNGNEILAYAFIFLGLIIEGEIVILFAGILAHLGGLDFLTLFLVGALSLGTKAFVGYYLGSYLKDRFPDNKFLQYIENKILYFLPSFKEKPFWSIFVSKFIYGINHFAIVLSGYLKINFITFFKAEFFASILWLIEFLALGYFFSYYAIGITKDIRKFSVLILIFIVVVILIERFLTFLFQLSKAKNKNV